MSLFSSISKIVGAGASVIGAVTGNPALSAIGSIAGGLSQNADAKQAAQDQMAFQQYNSSTAYQRAVADMKAAGINPMFALTAGGASTPSGASYSPSDAITPAVNTGLSARRLTTDQQVAQAGIENTKSDTALKHAQTMASVADAQLKTASAKQVLANTSMTNYNLPAAENEAAFQKTLGHSAPWIRNLLQGAKDVLGTAHSAKALVH